MIKNRSILEIRVALVAVTSKYVTYKHLAKGTSNSIVWNIYMLKCKKLKRELDILASWLHVLLWTAGRVKSKPRNRLWKVNDLAMTLNKRRLPSVLQFQSY